MNIFLKLKHWQLFGLLVCTYFAFQIAGTTTVISSQGEIKQVSEHCYFVFKTSSVISSQETGSDISTVSPSKWKKSVTVTKYSPIGILFIVVLCGWFYVVGVSLNRKLPDVVKMNLTKFKWLFFTPIICMFLSYIFTHFVLFKSVSDGFEPNFWISFAVIIPLYLFIFNVLFILLYLLQCKIIEIR